MDHLLQQYLGLLLTFQLPEQFLDIPLHYLPFRVASFYESLQSRQSRHLLAPLIIQP